MTIVKNEISGVWMDLLKTIKAESDYTMWKYLIPILQSPEDF